jgi:hypothetical protein
VGFSCFFTNAKGPLTSYSAKSWLSILDKNPGVSRSSLIPLDTEAPKEWLLRPPSKMRRSAREAFRSCMGDTCIPLRSFVLLFLIAVGPGLLAQETSIQIPADTPLPVQLGKHVPMRKGAPLECRLLYSVYAQNQLAIPAGTVLRGSVVALNSDRSRRIHSRLWGDFTPFHIPVVHFDR